MIRFLFSTWTVGKVKMFEQFQVNNSSLTVILQKISRLLTVKLGVASTAVTVAGRWWVAVSVTGGRGGECRRAGSRERKRGGIIVTKLELRENLEKCRKNRVSQSVYCRQMGQ